MAGAESVSTMSEIQLSNGRLERWDDDKGFGFIHSDNNPKGIFVHISAFKRNISRRPLVGDIIFYELHTDYDGKSKAVNARIEGVSVVTHSSRNSRNDTRRYQNNKHDLSATLVTAILVFLLLIGLVVTNKYQTIHESSLSASVVTEDNSSSSLVERVQTQYSCQGKTYCSQMSSCAEAQFYQSNCSGTQMDGDGDGVPCEDMCGH